MQSTTYLKNHQSSKKWSNIAHKNPKVYYSKICIIRILHDKNITYNMTHNNSSRDAIPPLKLTCHLISVFQSPSPPPSCISKSQCSFPYKARWQYDWYRFHLLLISSLYRALTTEIYIIDFASPKTFFEHFC